MSTGTARHVASPGPFYWEWRCLLCGHPVDDREHHRPWWRFWERR